MESLSKNTNPKIPAFTNEAQALIINGIYTHYKGNCYRVLAVGRHSETLEEFVVYQGLYGNEDVWVRPLYLFCEIVSVKGSFQPRFIFDKGQDVDLQTLLDRA